jgi:arsenite methyltransferase
VANRYMREPYRCNAFHAEFLGCDAAELAALPPDCTASFAGIGNPLAIGPIHEGETVLDIGCGAGMDLLLPARRTGATGQAIGVDMTDAMVFGSPSSTAKPKFPIALLIERAGQLVYVSFEMG